MPTHLAVGVSRPVLRQASDVGRKGCSAQGAGRTVVRERRPGTFDAAVCPWHLDAASTRFCAISRMQIAVEPARGGAGRERRSDADIAILPEHRKHRREPSDSAVLRCRPQPAHWVANAPAIVYASVAG